MMASAQDDSFWPIATASLSGSSHGTQGSCSSQPARSPNRNSGCPPEMTLSSVRPCQRVDFGDTASTVNSLSVTAST